MSLTIPTVITGRFSVEFPSKTPPICVPFDSPWRCSTVEVGLIETCVVTRPHAARVTSREM